MAMKVMISRFPLGWRYYASDSSDLKSDPFATYANATKAAVVAGHEIDTMGWRHKMESWNFTHHALDRYPGWEIEQRSPPASGPHGSPAPAFAKLAHTRGVAEAESADLCREWDDIAAADFYQRDWTDDGIPFVNDGETYWSGWWFATLAERDRFISWAKARDAAVMVP
jgi:hypothetical protein